MPVAFEQRVQPVVQVALHRAILVEGELAQPPVVDRYCQVDRDLTVPARRLDRRLWDR